jgi:hypothetical protein
LQIDGEGYTLDFGPIIGDHLSGTIDFSDVQPHGIGCVLQMMGDNNNWSGFWACFAALGGLSFRHSFTAISMRVEQERKHIVEQKSPAPGDTGFESQRTISGWAGGILAVPAGTGRRPFLVEAKKYRPRKTPVAGDAGASEADDPAAEAIALRA